MSKLKVEQFVAKIDELTPTENNPRQISKQDFENLKKSMKEFPEMREIRKVVVDENNRILGGHMRIKALKELGESEVPVDKVYGLTDKQKRRFVIQDNIQNGEWDMDELANSWSDLPLDEWGIGVEWDTSEQEVVEDEAPEVDDNEPADSVEGGVYQLGRHRLMCGDSTDAGSVATLMDGQKADMIFTDPPYGMELNTDFASMHALGNTDFAKREMKGRTYASVIGDNDDFRPELIETIFENFSYVKEMFIWGADYFAELIPNRNDGSWFVWDKRQNDGDDTNYAERMDKGYGSCFELCWSKTKHKRLFARIRWSGVFGMEKDDTRIRVHPTQKPAILAQWFIERFSDEGDLILDIYGGSGSTLIACEQLDRTCYMMELDPKYCDVIRKRYWKFKTGSEEGWQEGTKEAK